MSVVCARCDGVYETGRHLCHHTVQNINALAAELAALRAKLAAAEAVVEYARHRPGCMVGKPWRCECGYTDAAAAHYALSPKETPYE